MRFSRQEYWSGCHGLLRIILLRSPKLSLLFNHFDWRVIFQWDYLLSCWWALGVFPSLCLVTNVATIFLKSVSFLNECIHWLDCKRLRNDETVEASTSLSQRSKRDHGATFFPMLHLIGCLNFCQSSWCTKIFHCDFDLKYPCIYFYQKQWKISNVCYRYHDSNWLKFVSFSEGIVLVFCNTSIQSYDPK